MARPRRVFTTLVASLWLLLLRPVEARAYEEQASLDLSLGYGGLAAVDSLPSHLLSMDVGGSVGITDWLVARAAVGYGGLLGDDARHLGRARLELAYVIDILQWVPFLGVGGGLWGVDGSRSWALWPEGHFLVGVDYLASRSWTVGLDARSGGVAQPGARFWTTDVSFRISRVFEMF